MNYKLLALDIDGTILTSDSKLSSRTRQVILKVQEKGILVILATGRRLTRTIPLANTLGLHQPLVVHNGAVVYDQSTEKVLVQQDITLAVATKIIAQLDHLSINYVIYTGESAGERVLAPEGTWQEQKNLVHRYLGESAEFGAHLPLQAGPIRISIVDRPEKVDPLYDDLMVSYPSQINVMLFGAERDAWRGIEIIPPNCSKKTGLAYVATQLGITAEEVVAIGDNINDLEMITWAGLGVAVKDGSPLLRSQAKLIVPSSNQDGVAIFLEKLLL